MNNKKEREKAPVLLVAQKDGTSLPYFSEGVNLSAPEIYKKGCPLFQHQTAPPLLIHSTSFTAVQIRLFSVNKNRHLEIILFADLSFCGVVKLPFVFRQTPIPLFCLKG